MDKQPSEAARNAMHAALVEHDALDLNPRYPTARGVLRIDPLVTILADHAERYAAERERAALERVPNLVLCHLPQYPIGSNRVTWVTPISWGGVMHIPIIAAPSAP